MSEAVAETALDRVKVGIGAPMTDLDEAYRLSKNLAIASVMPDALRGKPSDVLAIVLYGNDLGLTPMQAIQGIYVVKGKPQLSSTLWTALARRQGHKVRWGHCDEKSATVTIIRSDDPDHPHTETFTIEDAIQAGLVRMVGGKVTARSAKGDALPWESYTKQMLRNRAISNAGKLQCPEVALGFAIEGDYDFIPDDQPVSTPVAPEIIDAEVVEELDADTIRDEVAAAEAEFIQTDELPLLTDDYVCQTCGVPGVHLTEHCPEATS